VKCHHMLGGKLLQRFHKEVSEHKGNLLDRDGSGEIPKKFSSWHVLMYPTEELSILHNMLAII